MLFMLCIIILSCNNLIHSSQMEFNDNPPQIITTQPPSPTASPKKSLINHNQQEQFYYNSFENDHTHNFRRNSDSSNNSTDINPLHKTCCQAVCCGCAIILIVGGITMLFKNQ